MKNFLLFALLFSTCIYAQKKTVKISVSKIGGINSNYSKSIDLEKKDSLYYVYCGFQNMEYSSITDIKSIMITEDVDLKSLIKDLKTAISEMDAKVSLNWKRQKYQLDLYDFSDKLYVKENPLKGNGYTTLSKREVAEFVAWLETINLGKG